MQKLLPGTIVFCGLTIAAGYYLMPLLERSAGAERPTAAPTVVVAVATVQEHLWQPTITATGTLRAFQGVDVTAQESGQVTAIQFSSGSQVRRGDILVQQYIEDKVVQLKGLKAELNLAQKSYNRSESLVGQRAVSQSQLDSTLSDMERTAALVDTLQVAIEQRSIRAPFDGVLGIRQINLGQYIEPGDAIVVLEALDPIYVEFTLPQSRLPEVHVGQSVVVSVDAYPLQEFTGKINAIEPRVDADTRTFGVQAEVPNRHLSLRPGMYVASRILLPTTKRVLTLPQAAIRYDPYGKSVFVVEQQATGDMVVRTVYLTLGETRGDQVSVDAGLQAGERVVTAGQLMLRDGTSVRIDPNTVVSNNDDPQLRDG